MFFLICLTWYFRVIRCDYNACARKDYMAELYINTHVITNARKHTHIYTHTLKHTNLLMHLSHWIECTYTAINSVLSRRFWSGATCFITRESPLGFVISNPFILLYFEIWILHFKQSGFIYWKFSKLKLKSFKPTRATICRSGPCGYHSLIFRLLLRNSEEIVEWSEHEYQTGVKWRKNIKTWWCRLPRLAKRLLLRTQGFLDALKTLILAQRWCPFGDPFVLHICQVEETPVDIYNSQRLLRHR